MQTLTQDQVKGIIDNRPEGVEPRAVIDGLVKRGYTLQGFGVQVEQPSLLKQAGSAIGETIGRIKEGTGEAFQKGVELEQKGRKFEEQASTQAGQAVGGIDRIAGGARAALSPIEGTLKESARGWAELGKLIMGTETGQDVKSKFQEITSRPDVQNIIKTYSEGGEVPVAPLVGETVQTVQETPGLRGAASLAGSALMLDVGAGAGKLVREGVEAGARQVEKNIIEREAKQAVKQAEKVGEVVDETISKAIKPRKQFNSDIERTQYVQKSRKAVDTIANNKPNLRLTDEAGDVVEGSLPQSVQQFSEALDQTKKSVFKQYDDLAKQTGATGVVVELNPVVKELAQLKDNVVLQDLSPQTAAYVDNMINTFSKRGSYNPSQAQEFIQGLNDELKAFYRNPSYGAGSKVAVDAMIATKLREQLDSVIETATGAEYQALKDQYAALKQIERDVVRAAQRVANKNNAGLVDALSGLATASQVAQFITTGGLSNLASGVATEGVRRWWNAINSPDRAIKKMFEKVDAARQSQNLRSSKTAIKDTIKATKNTIAPTVSQKPTKVKPLVKKDVKFESNQSFNQAGTAGVPKEQNGPFKISSNVQVDDMMNPKLFSIKDGDKIVGKLYLSKDKIGDKTFAHIDGIEINKTERGKGLGSKLMDDAIKSLEKSNYDGIIARHETIANKKEIPKIFNKLGFKDLGAGMGKVFNK